MSHGHKYLPSPDPQTVACEGLRRPDVAIYALGSWPCHGTVPMNPPFDSNMHITWDHEERRHRHFMSHSSYVTITT
jgi:hypothetical protein